ncbi:hypothetical protein D3C80_1762170 [compost metagenome]
MRNKGTARATVAGPRNNVRASALTRYSAKSRPHSNSTPITIAVDTSTGCRNIQRVLS